MGDEIRRNEELTPEELERQAGGKRVALSSGTEEGIVTFPRQRQITLAIGEEGSGSGRVRRTPEN